MAHIKKLKHSFLRLKSNIKGSVSVEFGLLVPGLIAMWLGAVTVMDMEKTSTKVGVVTATVSDILARSKSINRDRIDASFRAGRALLGADADDMELYVAGLRLEIQNPENPNELATVTVMWVRGQNISSLALPTVGSSFPLTDALRARDGFLVAAHGLLHHEPFVGGQFIGQAASTYEYKNFFTPRSSLRTDCTNC